MFLIYEFQDMFLITELKGIVFCLKQSFKNVVSEKLFERFSIIQYLYSMKCSQLLGLNIFLSIIDLMI